MLFDTTKSHLEEKIAIYYTILANIKCIVYIAICIRIIYMDAVCPLWSKKNI